MHMLNFLEPGEAESVLNDLKLDKKDLVIMPINNNQQNSVGGSHWALLCFYRSENKFLFFDSCKNMNLVCARRAGEMMTAILGATSPSFIVVQDTPQQNNSSDCGLHMLLMAELVAKCWTEGKVLPEPSMLRLIDSNLASDTRSALRILAIRCLDRKM